jgi:hypothetical protein
VRGLNQSLAHRSATAALEAAWRSGIVPEPRLAPDALAAAAIRSTGLSDFGEGWRAPFEALLQALDEEAELNAIGRTIASGQISTILRCRLRAQACWKRHPQILDRPLAPPIVIVGHMRSGTTRLQRLLACDPWFANARFFETFDPIPPSGLDLRRAQARLVLAALHALNPKLAAIHPTSPGAPEEQYGLLAFSFYGAQFDAQWRIPGFTRFWQKCDRAPVYAEFRRLLQTIGWSRGDDPARPWLLKAPQFMEDLEPLLGTIPGARLLCLHRDPAAIVGSSASLVWNQRIIQSDAADRGKVGQECLEKTVLRESAASSFLARHPKVSRLEMNYEEMDADWRREIRRIYDFLDRTLEPDVEARMERQLSRGGKWHSHRYRLEDFGLRDTQVRRQLGPRYEQVAATTVKAIRR